MFRRKLLDEYRTASLQELKAIDARIEAAVEEALEYARSSPEPDPSTVRRHVYAEPINPPEALKPAAAGRTETLGWLDAVRDGIAEEMRANPAILYFGEGTGERGGSFAHTKNLWQEFGAAADGRHADLRAGLHRRGGGRLGDRRPDGRPISMFADFAFETAGQIFLQAAKLRYMSNGQMAAPMVVRVGAGALRSSGPHHSGIYHPVFAHMPGLIVCVPSTPADAKGLMKTALRAGDPVIMLEPKALFASKGEVPVGEHFVPFGVARIAREGDAITLVAAGQMVPRALEAAETLAGEGIEAEVIDLRTIMPLDVETIVAERPQDASPARRRRGLGDVRASAPRSRSRSTSSPSTSSTPRSGGCIPSRPRTPSRRCSNGRCWSTPPASSRPRSRCSAGVAPVPDHWRAPGLAAAIAPVAARRGAGSGRKPAATKPPVAADELEITMPFGDLTVSEGRLVAWRKAVGDKVAEGELVAEIETDKAVVEIEAPGAGTLSAIEEEVGAMVPMGGRIGRVKKG